MPLPSALTLQKFSRVFTVIPHDVVGIEFRSDGARALRLKKTRQKLHIEAAERLADVRIAPDSNPSPLSLPASARAVHAGLVYDGGDAMAKLMNIPGNIPIDVEHVRDAMGLKGADHMRVGYQVLHAGSRRSESTILGAAMPDALAMTLPEMLTANRPVPYSIELSQITILNLFAEHHSDISADIDGFIVADTDYCVFAFLRKGEPLLMRRFPQGSASVLKHVARKLGVDVEAAGGIVRSGVLDLSAAIDEIVTPLIRQITLSRDFVERHANQAVSRIHVGGDPVLAVGLRDALHKNLNVTPLAWDPFSARGLDITDSGILNEQPWSFFAALGCCLGMLASETPDT